MARELHPRLKLLSPEDQKEALAELAKLNEITKLIWEANGIAQQALDALKPSTHAFVIEKMRNLQQLIADTQEGIEETIVILT